MAGVPFAGLLTALIFMLCIAQIGPIPVLVPAAVWAFWNGDTGWGIFVGPVVLAVAYTLLEAWMADGEAVPPGWRD